jgi:TetR/AcrR family transcriptional repressor of nem operon
MRYSREHKDETHKRIVRKAGERFRAEGIEAVGVASLMQSAGLTVGGFYAHFGSKEDLIAEACNDSLATTTALFRKFVDARPKGKRLEALVEAYLSLRHRDDPGNGCFVAANGAELARHTPETRAALSSQVNEWIALIDEVIKADGLKGDARGIAGALVGTMVLSRAIDDPSLSQAFLESGRKTILTSLGKPMR